MIELKVGISMPHRKPDIVLPRSEEEAVVSIWIKESLFRIDQNLTCCNMVHSNFSDWNRESQAFSAEEYIKATLEIYPADSLRVQAILDYYAEKELLGAN